MTSETITGDSLNDVVVTPDLTTGEQPAINRGMDQENGKKSTYSRIKYRVEYMNTENKVIHQYDAPGPQFDEENSAGAESTVLELVTTLRTNQETHDATSNSNPSSSSVPPMRTLHIRSRAIMQALRSVVLYYPSQDLSSAIIKISSPYTVLVHHYDELMEYRERCKFDPTLTGEICHREKDAYEHIGVLKDFLDEHVMPLAEEEKARNMRGYTTFDMLWLQMKPGRMVIIKGNDNEDDEDEKAGLVHSLSEGSLEHPKKPWNICYWTLDYDGDEIGRHLKRVTWLPWDGEADVYSVQLIDINDSPRMQNVANLVRRGGLYWRLLRGQYRYYKGRTKEFPHNEIDGLVMVDMDAYYEQHFHKRPKHMDEKEDSRGWISDCTCPVCSSRREAKTDKNTMMFADHTILPKQGGQLDGDLGDHQKLLLPGCIWAYVFRTRSWELLDVDNMSEPNFDKGMIESLVMDQKRVDMLKALANSFVRLNTLGEKSEREPWSADFVKGKGSGLIFLLHGMPGVGKTCTAECIAAFTSRPLMVLTSSDIGISPYEVEKNLTEHFKRAKRWGAVLLIDEADVFMERRSITDLNRNSLVAGFLRALEFYDGILFLTTNRVGSFDDAFLSRIHVQMYYPPFNDDDRRKVWKTFIDKLNRERGEYIRLNIDAKEYLEGKELGAVKWNGREIRNAFQTAVALAEYDAVKDSEGKVVLTDKHLKSVVEMSRDFKDYIDNIHQGDEDNRAERRRER